MEITLNFSLVLEWLQNLSTPTIICAGICGWYFCAWVVIRCWMGRVTEEEIKKYGIDNVYGNRWSSWLLSPILVIIIFVYFFIKYFSLLMWGGVKKDASND